MYLEVENLSGGYGGKDVCHGISCRLERGEVLCVLGPNGSGKSTFFRLLLGFLKSSSGTIAIGGAPASQLGRRALARRIAYIPQYHTPVFAYTVLELVMMGRTSHFSAFANPGPNDGREAQTALERLGLLPLANKKYTALSGGQRQMVLIARALCQKAEVLVMDEPAASLDYYNQRLVLDVVGQLSREGYCILLSTHSPEQPFSCAHEVLLLKEGRTQGFGPPAQVLTSESLRGVYGIDMDVLTVCDRYGTPHTLCLPVKKAGIP